MRLLGEKAQTMGFLDLKSYMIGLAGAGRSIGTEQQGQHWGLDIISAALGQKAGKNYKTESGSVVTVNDAKAAGVKELLVDIELVQAGSGDPSPSNIRAITGRTGANIYHEAAYDASAAPEISVSWQTEAGTVYGGTLNVTTGLLTLDRKAITLDGTETWTMYSGAFWTTDLSDRKYGSGVNGTAICDKMAATTGNVSSGTSTVIKSKDPGFTFFSSSVRMYCYESTCTTTAEWKAWLAANTPTIVYYLASPVTYQLTAQQLTMLAGNNAIWADTGDVTVTYLAE